MQPTIEQLQNLLNVAFTKAEDYNSLIDKEILDLPGMSSPKVRHLLNNLVRADDFQVNYLEIGTYFGSTFSSAIYKNENIFAIGVDNFGEFEGNTARTKVKQNLEKFRPNDNCFFVEKSFQNLTSDDLHNQLFNVYFYDGHHGYQSQYEALTKIKPFLQENFILLVDDWFDGEKGPINGTYNGLKDAGMSIIYSKILPEGNGVEVDGYWGGQFLGLIQQN